MQHGIIQHFVSELWELRSLLVAAQLRKRSMALAKIIESGFSFSDINRTT